MMEWKDYQVEVVDPGDLYAVLVANVGDAEIKGVSVELSARVWESLDVGLNAQFLDPKTKEANPIIGTDEGIACRSRRKRKALSGSSTRSPGSWPAAASTAGTSGLTAATC